jgi:hypothetical protein
VVELVKHTGVLYMNCRYDMRSYRYESNKLLRASWERLVYRISFPVHNRQNLKCWNRRHVCIFVRNKCALSFMNPSIAYKSVYFTDGQTILYFINGQTVQVSRNPPDGRIQNYHYIKEVATHIRPCAKHY